MFLFSVLLDATIVKQFKINVLSAILKLCATNALSLRYFFQLSSTEEYFFLFGQPSSTQCNAAHLSVACKARSLVSNAPRDRLIITAKQQVFSFKSASVGIRVFLTAIKFLIGVNNFKSIA